MKTPVKPTTIPHLVTCNGKLDLWVMDGTGDGVLIKPLGLYFACKVILKNLEMVVIFDNSNIGFVSIDDKRFMNELKDNMEIGVSVLGYSKCFSDFSNNDYTFV